MSVGDGRDQKIQNPGTEAKPPLLEPKCDNH